MRCPFHCGSSEVEWKLHTNPINSIYGNVESSHTSIWTLRNICIADTANGPLLFMEGLANKENVPENANDFQQHATYSLSAKSHLGKLELEACKNCMKVRKLV